MPTIRFLTPADFGDMCDIIDKHSSGMGAWCNDPTAPVRAYFRRLAKDHVDQCFGHGMTNFWGYFDYAGRLVSWVNFIRWADDTNITIRSVIEDPDAALPRQDGAVWSNAAVDLVNWGIGYFWSEGVSAFWCRMFAGKEDRHISVHPNCMLIEYQREKIVDIPGGKLPPEEYRRVSWSPFDDDTAIYRFSDPLPLAAYLESGK
ncbi:MULTISPECIES: hypothetical protein [unclassified Bradyrhizobium]|uniref:hypothetical protein n=1 Tax=unclassified Bradyrhizobium TaxID=2631580 RepID=UPI002916D75A|nr:MULTISPECIES: hypothetical protein [unclassified Bradyrhizobium]